MTLGFDIKLWLFPEICAFLCLWELDSSYPPQHEKAVQMEQCAH